MPLKKEEENKCFVKGHHLTGQGEARPKTSPVSQHSAHFSCLAICLLGFPSLLFGSQGCRAWGTWKSLNSEALGQSKEFKLFVE